MSEKINSEEIGTKEKIKYGSEENLKSYTDFLSDILSKTIAQTENLDSQANMVLAISSAMFIYSASKLETSQSAAFFVLSIFSALAALIILFAIHPPKYLRVKNKIESVKSLMGNKRITSYGSSEEYSERLIGLMGDSKKITDHYAAAIYNTNVNYYRPKRNLFKIAVKVLILGVAIATIVTAYQHIGHFFK